MVREEPEIVKILREEERIQRLESKASCGSTTFTKSDETLSPVQSSGTPQQTVITISKDISGNKKEGDFFYQDGKKYRNLFEFFPQMLLLLDKKNTVVNVNKRTVERLGYSYNELIEKDLFNLPFLTKESIKILKKTFSKNNSKKTISPIEVVIVPKDGSRRSAVANVSLFHDEHDEIINQLIVLSDIPKQKHASKKNQTHSHLQGYITNGIVLMNLKGVITYVNPSFLHLWGLKYKKDALGRPLIHFLHTTEKFIELIDSIKGKGEWIGRLTGVKNDNTVFPFQFTANMCVNESGTPFCILGSVIESISDTKEKKVHPENEERFRIILENSLDMIYQLNIEKQTCEYVSPSSLKILGYSPGEMRSFGLKNIAELIHPEDSALWDQHFNMITHYREKQNMVHSIEYRFKHKTRGYRWLKDICIVVFDENEPISVVGTLEDITEQKNIWDQLVKSEEKYRIIAETSADSVFTTDSLGRLTYVNPSFEKLCGRRKSQILATPFRNYLLEDSIYFFQQIFIDARMKNEKIENVELEIVSGDGNIVPVEANIAPLKKQDEFGGVVCTIRDITLRREIEDELKKNERLKTEFMNIAAHELRSPVTPIKGYLDLIIHDSESNEKIKNWAKISLRNAERLLRLVNDILDVARLDSDTMRFDMEKIDPVELLNEIIEDMRPAIVNKNLEFHVNIPSSLPHIIGDKHRLSQVLKNLIGNSLKFTDCGYIGLEVEKKDNHLLIAVVDTGIGISKDEIKKIFTKFYQAYTGEDRNNEGTGLGLFISKEIIKKHKGNIWAESEVGKGSRFVIQLPYVYKMIVDFKV
jgi:PAS domain S-box-containing protein